MMKWRRQTGIAIAAVLVLAACGTARASWFNKGQPVPDWGVTAARTPTPSYVGDASAVILYDELVETIDGSGRAMERRRKAVRILKPQGRDQLCDVTYDVDNKINYFRAWTITADEKLTFQAQDTDFAEVGDTDVPIMLSTHKTRIAHPPALDVGATLVCESEELMAPYEREEVWGIELGIPVVYEALELDLPAGKAPVANWHNHEPVKPVVAGPTQWRWELKDVPALNLRDVPSRPTRAALEARMSVMWGDMAAADPDAEWRAIGEWVTKLEADRPIPNPDITAKVQQLTVGAPDFYSRVRAITESIQKDVRYFIVMRGIGGLQANHASDIFRNRYGDCKDKTTLLIAMLQAAGIKAFYVPVDDERGVVDPADPSLAGNHMITAIEVPPEVNDPRLRAVVTAKNGKRYLIFDPTNERTPVGNLPSYEQGSYGTLCIGAESQVIALPVLASDANGTEQKGEFTLGPDGTLTGSVDTVHIGPEGGELRRFLKYTDEKERRDALEKAVAYDVPGITLTSLQFIQPPALDKPLEFHYKLTASQYAHNAGPLLLVRPRVVGSLAQAFNDKPRTVPIDLDATGRWHDSFDITLPAGYVVDETPDPVEVETAFASYKSSITARGNVLHYEREYVVKQVEIPASEAKEFRKLEGAILMDEKGTAVLKRAAAGGQ